MVKKTTYHLVLSWGWVRWLAHIGMYKALFEANYSISRVSGTSAGALVGLFIAAWYEPSEIAAIFMKYSVFSLLKPSFSPYGLFSMETMEEVIREHIHYADLSELPIPLRVCVSDLDSGAPIYYESWNILKIIIASCSVPGIFVPVLYEGKHLVDGGLYDNLPVIVRSKEPIIGLHVNPIQYKKRNSTKDIMIKAIQILVNRDITAQSKQCKIFLEPPLLAAIGQSPLVNIKKIIRIGYEYAKEALWHR